MLKLDTFFFLCFLLFLGYQCFPGEKTNQNYLLYQLSSLPPTRHHGGCNVLDFVRHIFYFLNKKVHFGMLFLPCCSRLLSVIVFFKVSLCCWKLFPEQRLKQKEKYVQVYKVIVIGYNKWGSTSLERSLIFQTCWGTAKNSCYAIQFPYLNFFSSSHKRSRSESNHR